MKSRPIFKFLSYVIAFIMPAYHAYNAFMANYREAEIQWLKFFICSSLIFSIETVLLSIFTDIPFFYEIKCFILVMLQLNHAIVSDELYSRAMKPFFDAISPGVENMLSSAQDFANAFKNEAIKS